MKNKMFPINKAWGAIEALPGWRPGRIRCTWSAGCDGKRQALRLTVEYLLGQCHPREIECESHVSFMTV